MLAQFSRLRSTSGLATARRLPQALRLSTTGEQPPQSSSNAGAQVNTDAFGKRRFKKNDVAYQVRVPHSLTHSLIAPLVRVLLLLLLLLHFLLLLLLLLLFLLLLLVVAAASLLTLIAHTRCFFANR